MTDAAPFRIRHFQAMGCPCEILIDTTDDIVASNALDAAQTEAHRIEEKYSRFRKGSCVDRLNTGAGEPVQVDEETAALLDYATECHRLSGGLFDITTAGIRNGSGRDRLGWQAEFWQRPWIRLPQGFNIDFGGICKEYAADRILSLLSTRFGVSTLVNLGGDIAAAGSRWWSVGIENPERPNEMTRTIRLRHGAVATSGTTKRPGHIVDPKTGAAVSGAPLSVTVAAKTCTEAGFWSTLAILHGAEAETFLDEQRLDYWCYRSPSSAQSLRVSSANV